MFTVAMSEWEWTTVNPATGIQPLPEGPGRMRYLSHDERKAVFAETVKDPVLHTFVD